MNHVFDRIGGRRIVDISFSAKQIAPSATLAINERINTIRGRGEQVYHMGFGESPFPVHSLIRKALCDNSWRQSYLPTQGIFQLRAQISKFYKTMFDLQYSPEQIMVGPGSKSLMFAALAALDGPIFLPAPSWVSYQHMGRFTSRDVHHMITDSKNSYRLEPELLVNALQQNAPDPNQQKILVLNYPSNPTGHSYSAQQLRKLADVARENKVIILSDEIYALTHFQDQEHTSIAEIYPEGTLVTGGLSKDRSMGGYRLGALLIPEGENQLMRTLLAIGSEIWSCVSAPLQYAAIEAYRTDTGIIEYVRDCATIHEVVTSYVYQRIQAMGLSCPSPQGAFYLFPDWNQHKDALRTKSVTTSNELAQYLLEEYHVSSLPGSEFGMPAEDLCLRLATVDYKGELALDTFLKDRDSLVENPEQFVVSIAPSVVEGCNQLEVFMFQLGGD
ncbi:MAG: pyridoxal phosphate-dependent aminotransferase [Candidatus Thorarchaeota archaeon]